MGGFNLDLSQSSGDHNGQLETYSVDAGHSTLLAIGDVVRKTGTADTEGVAGVDAITQGQSITGIVAGFKPQFAGENLTATGLAIGLGNEVFCHIDPNLNFIVDVTGTPLVADDVGLNIDADVTAATQSGLLVTSNMAVDSSTKLSTVTLQFNIVGLVPNSAGVIDGTKARVRINNSTLRAGTVGI